MRISTSALLFVSILHGLVPTADTFSLQQASISTRTSPLAWRRMASSDESGEEDDNRSKDMKIVKPPEDDVSKRFKYKVNALLGAFDPSGEDTEAAGAGNILNAMLKFPTTYSFHVVGKGDARSLVDKVKAIVEASASDVSTTVTPRGSKFTKVTCEATVESAAMITQIYEEIGAMEESVMQF